MNQTDSILSFFIALEADDNLGLPNYNEAEAGSSSQTTKTTTTNPDGSQTTKEETKVEKKTTGENKPAEKQQQQQPEAADDDLGDADDLEANAGEEDDGLGDDMGDDMGGAPEDTSADSEESNSPFDNKERKNQLVLQLINLHSVVSSNIDTLGHLEVGFSSNNERLSILRARFNELQSLLYRLLTEPKYVNADYPHYLKYFISVNRLYDITIDMMDTLLVENKNKNKEKRDSNVF